MKTPGGERRGPVRTDVAQREEAAAAGAAQQDRLPQQLVTGQPAGREVAGQAGEIPDVGQEAPAELGLRPRGSGVALGHDPVLACVGAWRKLRWFTEAGFRSGEPRPARQAAGAHIRARPRMAAPTRPNPAIISAQLVGSGTAPGGVRPSRGPLNLKSLIWVAPL